jgi:hypothetical protein
MLAFAGGMPAQADVSAEMQAITRFCLGYVESGQPSDLLLQNGFSQAGRKFRKSQGIGSCRASFTVDPRRSTAGLSCSATVGPLGRNDFTGLVDAAKAGLRAAGYSEQPVTTAKGRKMAYVKNGVALELGGSNTSSHSAYSVFLYFQRLN